MRKTQAFFQNTRVAHLIINYSLVIKQEIWLNSANLNKILQPNDSSEGVLFQKQTNYKRKYQGYLK